MKKSRFSERQIVSILKESEGGIPIADILRTHGISQGTFYKWRSKYSGLEASELKRMKDLGSSYLNIKRWLLSFLEITERSRT